MSKPSFDVFLTAAPYPYVSPRWILPQLLPGDFLAEARSILVRAAQRTVRS